MIIPDENKKVNPINLETIWYQSNLAVYLNLWFANYEEARNARERDGGFLLPYKKHFYVCEPGVIRTLGLNPDDPDWEKVGRDCAQPLDIDAFERLRDKRLKAIQSK
jgi:hypothetical protein